MKIIIDDVKGKAPLIFVTEDRNLVNSLLHALSRYGVKTIIPDSVILAYRNEKENHFHFGGANKHELSYLTEEVLDTIMEDLKK